MITNIKPPPEHGHFRRLWSIYLVWIALATIIYSNYMITLPTNLVIFIQLSIIFMLAVILMILNMFYWYNLKFYSMIKIWPASRTNQFKRWLAIRALVEEKFYQTEQKLLIAASHDFYSSLAQDIRRTIEIIDEDATRLTPQLPRHKRAASLTHIDNSEIVKQKINLQKLRHSIIWWYQPPYANNNIVLEDITTICKN